MIPNHPHYRSEHTWNSIYVDLSTNYLNYSCSEAKYSIRSEEKVQTIIPVLWIVLKPVSAQFDAVVPAGSPPRLRSMWHSSPGGRATPPIVLGGNYTDYHYTLVQGYRGSSRQTQSLDLHIGRDKSNNSIYSTSLSLFTDDQKQGIY